MFTIKFNLDGCNVELSVMTITARGSVCVVYNGEPVYITRNTLQWMQRHPEMRMHVEKHHMPSGYECSFVE